MPPINKLIQQVAERVIGCKKGATRTTSAFVPDDMILTYQDGSSTSGGGITYDVFFSDAYLVVWETAYRNISGSSDTYTCKTLTEVLEFLNNGGGHSETNTSELHSNLIRNVYPPQLESTDTFAQIFASKVHVQVLEEWITTDSSFRDAYRKVLGV